MFPRGGPGVGLLLLRIATAAMFALNVTHPLLRSSPALYWVGVSLIALISFLLCIGFLTPFVAAVACAAAVANFLGSGGANGGLNPLYQIGGSRSIQFALKLQF